MIDSEDTDAYETRVKKLGHPLNQEALKDSRGVMTRAATAVVQAGIASVWAKDLTPFQRRENMLDWQKVLREFELKPSTLDAGLSDIYQPVFKL